jgi:hypothetical protein
LQEKVRKLRIYVYWLTGLATRRIIRRTANFISCVAEGDKIAVLSAENGSVVKTFEPVQFPYFNIGAKWSPDGQSLI